MGARSTLAVLPGCACPPRAWCRARIQFSLPQSRQAGTAALLFAAMNSAAWFVTGTGKSLLPLQGCIGCPYTGKRSRSRGGERGGEGTVVTPRIASLYIMKPMMPVSTWRTCAGAAQLSWRANSCASGSPQTPCKAMPASYSIGWITLVCGP